MPVRFTTRDITVPAHAKQKADWLAVSWDVRNADSQRLFQVIVVPGAVFFRNEPITRASWRKRSKTISDGTSIVRESYDSASMMDYAISETVAKLDQGYEWVVRPFMFEMNPLDYPHWPKSYRIPTASGAAPPVVGRGPKPVLIRTLGDAVASMNERVYADLLSKSFVERVRKH